ncbi:hypothetical protein BDQ12DRAFT_701476 [Crucibulum laeve]|uniref:Caspase domain-containing protein n=1 Tax=Crucibulum laeve TaxID=68775 RepID=A0A5C3LGG9_9AGAR|nr:hypothetical protein BDQ12DRAFT_701476 [Crucibulum laeve]
MHDLTSAVGDANSFEKYLLTRLHVPPLNILNLRDEQATRDGILSGFLALEDNNDIQKGVNSIIIYYAGHGSRDTKPEEWGEWVTPEGKIEMLCPYDIGRGFRWPNGVEGRLNGIPDRTISALLNNLASAKGDNIATGINRGNKLEDPSQQGYVPRYLSNPPPTPPDCDHEILARGKRVRSGGFSVGFSGKFHASHVLLAACGRAQSAWEHSGTGKGLFTKTLLEVLESHDIDDLTYTSLMHLLDMPQWQTPHCEGQAIQRRLFNHKSAGTDGSFHLCQVMWEDNNPTLIMQAGAAQGITVNSRFTVHASNLIPTPNRPNPSLGSLSTSSVDACTSTLIVPMGQPAFALPQIFYCKLFERGSEILLIYCEDGTWLESIFTPEHRTALSVALVSFKHTAELVLTIESGRVRFSRNDSLVSPHLGKNLPRTVSIHDIGTIREVVRCYLNFNHHLTRTGSDFRNVWMELKTLRVDWNDLFHQVLTPTGPNLIEEEPATMVVDDEAKLGMTIYNQTDLPLYPYLFYLDPSDLTIDEWYLPPIGIGNKYAKVDAPLPPKSELTIGYGAGGVAPWQFHLREGDTKDLGFFKLFLTTSPTSFSSITQESPFDVRGVSRHGKVAKPKGLDSVQWGTKLSTIIQIEKPRV